MSLRLRFVVLPVGIAVASLTIAALALVNVIAAWGVLFFYVLPTLFFGVWAVREFAPDLWRQTGTPVRRFLRGTRLAPPTRVPEVPPAPPPRERRPRERPERIRSPSDAFEAAAYHWLVFMRGFLDFWRSGRVKLVFNVLFGVAAAAILLLVGRNFLEAGWPFTSAKPAQTAAAVAFFLSTFAIRALAWQRLFRPFERPRSLTLVTSTGTAAVAAVALPSRVDDAISLGILRRLSRRAPSIGTLVLSLFLLGLMDMAALAPFAIYAAVFVPAASSVRVGMGAVAFIGVGAATLAASLPWIRTSERLTRYRLGHWLARHAPASRRDGALSALLVGASWLSRIGGLYLLLDALGTPSSFAVATAYVAAAAAASTLPIGPAGAATQAGVGAAVLAGAGIDGHSAVALAIAAQALTVGAGAVFAGFGGFTYYVRTRRA